MRKKINFVVVALIVMPPLFFTGCFRKTVVKRSNSAELQQLVIEDQLIRNKEGVNALLDKEHYEKETKKNLMHRKKVEQIFRRGGSFSAKDYLAAALIYQHGNQPTHYYQAYIWAKKAIKMGEKSGNSLMASTIDRFLISTGKKQLFGTQILIKKDERLGSCFCVYETELEFPDILRKKYTGHTLEENIRNNMLFFGIRKYCPNCCGPILKKTNKNTIPGLW